LGNLHHNYIISKGGIIGYGKGHISFSSGKYCRIYYNTTSLSIFDYFSKFILLIAKTCLLETHQKLAIAGVILLVTTFLINYYHQEVHPGIGFNYAYISGIAMLAVFLISFVMFTKDRLKAS